MPPLWQSNVIDGKDVSTDEIRQLLLSIQLSFESPLLIKVESDCQPRQHHSWSRGWSDCQRLPG
jgi:hypothetical protein